MHRPLIAALLAVGLMSATASAEQYDCHSVEGASDMTLAFDTEPGDGGALGVVRADWRIAGGASRTLGAPDSTQALDVREAVAAPDAVRVTFTYPDAEIGEAEATVHLATVNYGAAIATGGVMVTVWEDAWVLSCTVGYAG